MNSWRDIGKVCRRGGMPLG